jgi:hypothetical protein
LLKNVSRELIGGLDIVKELVESGEFKSVMPQQESLNDKLVYLYGLLL